MKAIIKRLDSDNKRVIELKKCPYCNASQYSNNRNCFYCGKYLNVRRCPYCDNIIPDHEDPCRYCGHLKPAAIEPENDASVKVIKYHYSFLVMLFLVSGVAMIIWPESNPFPDYACDMYDPDDCTLPFLIWGRPGGIFLIGLASIFIGWYAIVKSRVNKS